MMSYAEELERLTLTAAEPDDCALGVVLDDRAVELVGRRERSGVLVAPMRPRNSSSWGPEDEGAPRMGNSYGGGSPWSPSARTLDGWTTVALFDGFSDGARVYFSGQDENWLLGEEHQRILDRQLAAFGGLELQLLEQRGHAPLHEHMS